ncbi:protease modulator HflC [Motiliproteus coralliicola]|uniref:Protein HflC n=1 Tax=Motiliproteus coralliicola TaxID=2283196 RepID=A0A369WC81_9GAMM|nr:protease modulator HflC [Motiliproteus coralliicola]RDE19628.1 protease modulator HflC [Motiliproteus coralliicola]
MNSGRTFAVMAALLLLVVVANNSLFIIKETERAVKLQFGEVVNPDLKPGLHIKMPIVNSITKFDGRVQTLDSRPQDYLTLEKKRLIVDSFVKWRIADVKTYYTATSGDEFRAADLLASRMDTRLRNKFGRRTLTEVVSGDREEMMVQLTKELTEITQQELGIEVVDVRVKRIDLPTEVSQSVYDRMRTEREREARELRSKGNELAEGIRADADRQKTVILAEAFREAEQVRGDGDAVAASTYAQAYQKDPEFYSFYRSLNAYKDTFNSKDDVMVLEPGSDFFKYLNAAGGAGLAN